MMPGTRSVRQAAALVFLLGLVGCGGDGGTGPASHPVGSVTLSQGSVSLVQGATFTLVASVRDTTGATIDRPVAWSSSSSAVVQVSGGTVTAVGAGTATVTATAEGRTGQATITVRDGAVISSSGGAASGLSGAVSLTIPAGAVPSPVAMTIESAAGFPSNARLVPGTAVELGPSGQSFAAPVQLRIKYSPAQVPAGESEATLRIHKVVGGAWQEVAGSSVDLGTQTVTANLTSFSTYGVVATGPRPEIALSVASLTFNAVQGEANPASRQVTITNSGGGHLINLSTGTIAYGAGASGWIGTPSLSGTAANPSAIVTVAPSIAGLTAGTYTASVPIESPVASNTPQSIQVTLVVAPPPAINLSSASLTFNAFEGGANPAAQVVTITNGGGGLLSGLAAGTIVYGAGPTGWIQVPLVSPSAANPSAQLTVQPLTGSLPAGTYTGTIPITSSVASNSPQVVTVTFIVSGIPQIALTPSSLTFNALEGGANPAAQQVTITNSGTGVLSQLAIGSIAYGAGASNWLQAPVLGSTTANPSTTLGVQPLTAGLAPGTYTATIQVTSPLAPNSPRIVFVTFIVASIQPDFVIDAVGAPGAGSIGGMINVTGTVRNQGASTSASFRVTYWYSTDAIITTGDTYSGIGCTFGSGLAGGTTADCNGAIPVPVGLTPGTWYVGAIVDDLGAVVESQESNNARAAASPTILSLPGGPDLVVDLVTADPTGTVGGNINVSATIRNQGVAGAGAFRAGFYYSTDATITTADVFSGSICNFAAGMGAGNSTICAGMIGVPGGLPPGQYYVGVVVDDQLQVGESNESNNARAAASQTTINAVAGPDFIVETMTAPANGTIGSTIDITSSVRNQGTATGASFRVTFWYSTDATITTGDTFSGSGCVYASGLGANATATCNGPISVPGGLTPGAWFVGAIVDDLSQVSETNESNNTRAAAATTALAASAGLNLVIDGMYLTQATQSYLGSVPIVAGRDAFLRVFVKATQANAVAPNVRVRFYQGGSLVDTRTLAAPQASVPTSITEGTLTSSWNYLVPGAMVMPGLSILADVDPSDGVAETNEGDNTFPLNGTPGAVDVRTVGTFHVTFVPVLQTANGLTGVISPANEGQFLDKSMRVWPFGTMVSTQHHATYTSNRPALTPNGTQGWADVLFDIATLQAVEGSSRNYYGVAKLGYVNGILGIGYIGFPVSLGHDDLPQASETTAHEFGHNFGRTHAPCGGPANPDLSYPYAGAVIGAHGYDMIAAAAKATTLRDLMSYCSPSWISDYTYSGALSFILANPTSPRVIPAQSSTLISGRIVNGQVLLEPALDVVAPPSQIRPGPYRIVGSDATGTDVISLAFSPTEVADAGVPSQHFAFVVPKASMSARPMASLRVTGPGGASAVRRSTGAATAAASGAELGVATRRAADRVELTWNAAQYPLVMVRSVETGEVLTFGRSGTATLVSTAGEIDVVFSDGTQSVSQRLRVR